MDVFIGTILVWAPNFAPRSYSYCNGGLIAISQNSALFSLLGTNYGGDGQTTFGLPDLRSRVADRRGHGRRAGPLVLSAGCEGGRGGRDADPDHDAEPFAYGSG